MKIRVLETVKGSNNGVDLIQLKEGQCYNCPSDLSKSLVDVLLKGGLAEEVKEKVEIEVTTLGDVEKKVVEVKPKVVESKPKKPTKKVTKKPKKK